MYAADEVPTTAEEVEAITGWADTVKAGAGDVVLVKAKTNGVNLDGTNAGITSFSPDDGADTGNLSAAEIDSSNVYKFTMPAKAVTITAVSTDKVTVKHGFAKNDGTALNLQTDKAVTYADTDAGKQAKAEFAVAWLQANGYPNAKVNPANIDGTGATGVDIGGKEIAIANIHVANDLVWVTVDGKDIVSSTASDKGLDKFLALAGITSDAKYFVKKTAANVVSAVAFNDTGDLTEGDVIDTNSGIGWMKTDGITAITATADVTGATNTLTDDNVGTLVLTVTVADGDQFKDTNIYVKVGATGTINVKSAEGKAYTVADHNIKALIGVTGGAVEGSYKTAAAVPELAIGKVLNSTTGVNLTFTFDAADAAAGVSALKVTFTEA